MPELPVVTMLPPTLMSTSISVLTVAQVSPSSVTCPTSAPYSVMTGSPYSMPLRAPLLMVKEEDQLEEDQRTTLLDSST